MTLRQVSMALVVLLCACTPIRPVVELTTGAKLEDYHAFEVAPVQDASGYTLFPWPVEDSLRLRLVEQLQHHKLKVVTAETDSASPAGVAVLQGTLTFFRSGSYNIREAETRISSRCRFTTVLIDKQTGARIGRIESAEDNVYQPFQVLMQCARLTVDELARRLK